VSFFDSMFQTSESNEVHVVEKSSHTDNSVAEKPVTSASVSV